MGVRDGSSTLMTTGTVLPLPPALIGGRGEYFSPSQVASHKTDGQWGQLFHGHNFGVFRESSQERLNLCITLPSFEYHGDYFLFLYINSDSNELY